MPLARWRARHQLVEIRTNDLMFRLDETSEFLKHVMKLDLSDDNISLLEERTEGWVAGLQLAALSIRNRKQGSGSWMLEAGHRDIADYLLEETFSQLSTERQEFLLQTSLVSRLSDSLCNAITQRTDSQMLLDELDADNLFMTALDDRREWFRYHHLFAEFLRNRLIANSSVSSVRVLRRRASYWLADNGFMNEAIDHALAAEDFEYAACLIGPQSEAWMRRGEASTVLSKLNQLPESLVWDDYGLCLWYGWVLAQTNHPESSESWADRAEILIHNCFPDPADNDARNGLGQVLAIRALVARRKSDTNRAVELSQRALELIPPDNLNLKTIVSANLHSALLESGDFDQMENSLKTVQYMAQVAENPYIRFLMLANQSALAMMRGQLHLAHNINVQILRLTESEGLSRLAPLPHIRLGRVFYFWNDLAKARYQVNGGLQLATPVEHATQMVNGFMTLAFIENAEGQFESALKMLDKGKHIAQENGLTTWAERLEACEARLRLSAGEMDAVIRWVRSSRWESFDLLNRSNPSFNDESFFTLCRYLIALENPDEWNRVAHLLEWRLKDAEHQNRGSTILEIRLMQALLYQAQNNLDLALTALTQALSLAKPEKFIRPFLDSGNSIALLLRRVPHSHPARDFARQILLSFSNADSKPFHTLIDPLNEQEMKILHLIAQGLSNPEIARQRVLAVSTVRWYVKQIFQKLGVHNRTQAAAQARELNLL